MLLVENSTSYERASDCAEITLDLGVFLGAAESKTKGLRIQRI